MKTLSVLLLHLSFLFYFTTSAQAPPNDDCQNAAILTVSTDCSFLVNGTISGATQSDTVMTCGAYTSSTAKDVWYMFTGSSGTAYSIVVTPTSGMDAVVHLRQGSCSNQATLACADNNGSGGAETLIYNVTSAGVYYVLIYGYTYTTDTPTTKNFTICVASSSIGIEEPQKDFPFMVFPNPTTASMHIAINRLVSNASLSVYNSLGDRVCEDKITGSADLTIQEPPGIYFMVLTYGENKYKQRLVFQ